MSNLNYTQKKRDQGCTKIDTNIETKNASNNCKLCNYLFIFKQLDSRCEGKTKKRKQMMVLEEIEKKRKKKNCFKLVDAQKEEE